MSLDAHDVESPLLARHLRPLFPCIFQRHASKKIKGDGLVGSWKDRGGSSRVCPKERIPVFAVRSTRKEKHDGVYLFPSTRRLNSHTSCVNALTFSSGDGRFLASGGDGKLATSFPAAGSHIGGPRLARQNMGLPSRRYQESCMRVCWPSGMSGAKRRLCGRSRTLNSSKGNIFTISFSANNRYIYAYELCLASNGR